eukprot:15218457-Alexandrium_andersonii.AAC.1
MAAWQPAPQRLFARAPPSPRRRATDALGAQADAELAEAACLGAACALESGGDAAFTALRRDPCRPSGPR